MAYKGGEGGPDTSDSLVQGRASTRSHPVAAPPPPFTLLPMPRRPNFHKPHEYQPSCTHTADARLVCILYTNAHVHDTHTHFFVIARVIAVVLTMQRRRGLFGKF